jgi:hypothetical protein
MINALSVPSAMTEREFGMVFTKLAMQLRATDTDIVTIKSYYEAMRDCPLDTVQASAQGFAREAGRKWFPTTGEWHEAAQAVLTAQLKEAIKPARDEPWHFDCETCLDTGWMYGPNGVPLMCPERPCGDSKEHSPHTWTKACPCRPMNPTYQRHQKFGAGE